MTPDPAILLRLAERVEELALNMTKHIFPDEIRWDRDALADAANAFTVAASLRAIAAKETK